MLAVRSFPLHAGNVSVQIVSFRRLIFNVTHAYLKYHVDSEGNPASLSFTGTEDDPNTSKYQLNVVELDTC